MIRATLKSRPRKVQSEISEERPRRISYSPVDISSSIDPIIPSFRSSSCENRRDSHTYSNLSS